MKTIFLITTIVLQFLCVVTLKLLDSFAVIVLTLWICGTVGAIGNFSGIISRPAIRNIFWGLFYGSICSLALLLLFAAGLFANFSN